MKKRHARYAQNNHQDAIQFIDKAITRSARDSSLTKMRKKRKRKKQDLISKLEPRKGNTGIARKRRNLMKMT